MPDIPPVVSAIPKGGPSCAISLTGWKKITGCWKMHPVPKHLLPPDCREGDVLVEEGGIYRLDPQETARRKARLAQKLEKLRKKAQKD